MTSIHGRLDSVSCNPFSIKSLYLSEERIREQLGKTTREKALLDDRLKRMRRLIVEHIRHLREGFRAESSARDEAANIVGLWIVTYIDSKADPDILIQ